MKSNVAIPHKWINNYENFAKYSKNVIGRTYNKIKVHNS